MMNDIDSKIADKVSDLMAWFTDNIVQIADKYDEDRDSLYFEIAITMLKIIENGYSLAEYQVEPVNTD